MSKKKTSIMKYVFIFIVGVILYSLFNKFIWHKYVVHPTAWDALEGEAGQPGVMHDIDHDNRIAVLTPEDGFHVYIVARGFLGWNIEDEISLLDDESKGNDGANDRDENGEPFTIKRTTLQLKGDRKLDTVLIVSRDSDIGYMTARDERGNTHGFNGSPNNGTYLYYIYSQDGFDDNLTFEAYTYDDELLYTK